MRTILLAALSAVAIACSSNADDGPPSPHEYNLEKTACRFTAPRSAEGQKYFCADLSVPENRRSPSSRTIKLHVAIIRGKPGGVPTIELVGGPGASSDRIVGSVAAGFSKTLDVYGPMLAEGDLVFFDQRGTGRSVPRLGCTEVDGATDPIAHCKMELEGQGIDLAAYDTTENANDVHDLKLALGVSKVNLHATSYGTRLGTEVMKHHPDDVRAAILDGVAPVDVSHVGAFEIAIDAILTRIFSACQADPKCNAWYPDLNGSLAKLKEKLSTTPFVMKDPATGTSWSYDWYQFVGELIRRSYEAGYAARVPSRITDLLEQDQAKFEADQVRAADERRVELREEDRENPLFTEYLDLIVKESETDRIAAETFAWGMQLSVTCNDYVQHESIAAAKAESAKIRSELRAYRDWSIEQQFASCKAWPSRPSDSSFREPPAFAVPTLLIGGDLDPATPGAWADHVARTLPKSQLVKVPTGAHGLLDACGGALRGAFLSDPTHAVDARCATDRALKFF